MSVENRSTAIPCLRYRDAKAAIDFLCRAFGFTQKMVVPGDGDTIAHAELTHSAGMIMLGSMKEGAYDNLMARKTPRELGGGTQSVYVVVADADAHHARALKEGAEIVIALATHDYGRDYTCRDPEGHVWTFGSYDPWAS
ncbi:MAG: VOC family protein [Pseudorhodoplanes sp.]